MDNFVRALIGRHHAIRLVACDGRDAVSEAVSRHGYPAAVADIYGRGLIATYLMRQLQKEGTLSLNIESDGALQKINYYCDEEHLKGAVLQPSPETWQNFTTNGQLLSPNGQITCYQTLLNRQPFVGRAPLVKGDVAADMAYYYQVSEQVPSVVLLTVKYAAAQLISAAGLIIQLMPQASEEEIVYLENTLSSLANFSDQLVANRSLTTTLEALFENVEIIEQKSFSYHCDCSRSRTERALLSAGAAELRAIKAQEGKAEVQCHYCNRRYQFDSSQLTELIEEVEKDS